MNSTMKNLLEEYSTVRDQTHQQRQHSSRNILPIRTNVKAGGRDEIAARIQAWLQSHTPETTTDEAAV